MNEKTGNLSFLEWKGKWKSTIHDPELQDDEFESFSESLSKFLENQYGTDYLERIYVRGDCVCDDRTEYIILEDSSLLTMELIKGIQNFLVQNGYRMWRVFVPTLCTPETMIAIYPGGVRISSDYEPDIEQAITKLAIAMKSEQM